MKRTAIIALLALLSASVLSTSGQEAAQALTPTDILRSTNMIGDLPTNVQGRSAGAQSNRRLKATGDANPIPSEFRSLLPLARAWAVGDDSERCEFLASSPPHSKRAMLSAVFPHFEQLESWLAAEKTGLTKRPAVRDLELLLAAATEATLEAYFD